MKWKLETCNGWERFGLFNVRDEKGNFIAAAVSKEEGDLIVAAPAMKQELQGILRCFDRDTVPSRHFDEPRGTGVNVGIIYQQATRIRELLESKGD